MSSPEYVSHPDALIDEVRAIRRDLARRFDNDLDRLIKHLREIEKQHADRVATPADMRSRRRDDPAQ